MQSVQLKTCRFDYDYSAGYCQTVFADGKITPASPEDTEPYRQTAMDLGYGNHIIQMCFDHELLHTLLSENRGLEFSPVLRHVADGGSEMSEGEIGDEEARVLSVQKALQEIRCRPHFQ